MYLEHFHLAQSPFKEEPDIDIFFPGAQREEICQSLVLDILAGKSLIKLIGREGSGKTLVCQAAISRLPGDYQVVYIDNPTGAFDDLMRLICMDLGMPPANRSEKTDYFTELRDLFAIRQASIKRMVLVIDEAEKLFLATLERLIRHITDHQFNVDIVVILAGRPGLETNLEQLAAFCAHVDFSSRYFLDSLSENETRQYLRFRLGAAGLSGERQEDVFTDGAVAKIYNASQGNPRMINIMAEESLQVSYSEKSFMVLLDHVDPASRNLEKVETSVVEIYDFLQANKMLMAGVVLVVAVVIALGLLLSGKDKPSTANVTQESKAIEVIRPPQPASTTASSTPNQVEKNDPIAKAESPAPQTMPQAQSSPAPETKPVAAALPANQGSNVGQPSGEQRDGDKLFRDRRGASAGWLAGSYRGAYTIQLMMLVSDQAQANISTMLIQDDYFALKDNFYILRKKTTPPTLFVFYGIYDTMDAAREARNNMPVFLRKHHPYPLAIADAMKKGED